MRSASLKRKQRKKEVLVPSHVLAYFILYNDVLDQKDAQNFSFTCTFLYADVSKLLHIALGGVRQCYILHRFESLCIALTRNWFTYSLQRDVTFVFQQASCQGHVEIVQLLLADARVDPSAYDNRAIQIASASRHAEVVELLLADPRVDPSADDNYAIRWASRHGHVEVVTLLLADVRVDPSANNNFAVRWASRNGHIDVINLLLADVRVDPSANNNFAIRYASHNGHTEVVQLLLADARVDLFIETN